MLNNVFKTDETTYKRAYKDSFIKVKFLLSNQQESNIVRQTCFNTWIFTIINNNNKFCLKRIEFFPQAQTFLFLYFCNLVV